MKKQKNDSTPATNTKSNNSDKDKTQSEDKGYITMDMPEVKDIPGQENIRVPKMKEMYDTTISSDDEEGVGILDDLNKEEVSDEMTATSSDVSKAEKRDLKRSASFVDNDERRDLEKMALDSTDEDGDPLNEAGQNSDRFGEDLDVPGSDLDDSDEKLGEEDEENNTYSRND